MGGLRNARRTISKGAAGVLVAGASLLLGAPPAQADGAFIEVNPNPAQAGTRVNLRASCGDDNTHSAKAQSEAFGRAMLIPKDGILVQEVTIPSNKRPGPYAVNLTCRNNVTATTTLTVTNVSQSVAPSTTAPVTPPATPPPTRGPATGGGGMAGRALVPQILAGALPAIAVDAGFGLTQTRGRCAETGH